MGFSVPTITCQLVSFGSHNCDSKLEKEPRDGNQQDCCLSQKEQIVYLQSFLIADFSSRVSSAQRKSVGCVGQISNQPQTAQEQTAARTWLLYALIIPSDGNRCSFRGEAWELLGILHTRYKYVDACRCHGYVQGSHMPHCPVAPSQSSESWAWLNKGNGGRTQP